MLCIRSSACGLKKPQFSGVFNSGRCFEKPWASDCGICWLSA